MNQITVILNLLELIRSRYDIVEVAIYKKLEYLKLFSCDWYWKQVTLLKITPIKIGYNAVPLADSEYSKKW